MIPAPRLRWTAPTLVALIVGGLAAPASAAPGPRGYPERGPGGGPCFHERLGDRGPDAMFDPEMMAEMFDARADRIAEILDLTADQRAAFEKLRTDALDAARPQLERMRQAGSELRELLDAGSSDAAQVGARMIEMHQLRGELRATRKSVEAELSKLLTSEQRFAFEALKEARHDFAARFGPGAERGHRFRDDRLRDHPAAPNG
jgi:Spy/CpxP family protein refolding chaperone